MEDQSPYTADSAPLGRATYVERETIGQADPLGVD